MTQFTIQELLIQREQRRAAERALVLARRSVQEATVSAELDRVPFTQIEFRLYPEPHVAKVCRSVYERLTAF